MPTSPPASFDELGGSVARGRRTLGLFGIGQFSRSIQWSLEELLIAYHLVERLGFSGALAGAILFATVTLSAIPDLFVATWLARRRDPAASALRAQTLFGAVAMGAVLLLFGPTPQAEIWKIIYIGAVSILFRFGYAVFDVSQNALISLLPESAGEVRRFVVAKTMASGLGRFVASLLVFLALSAPANPHADLWVAGLITLPVLLGVFSLGRVKPPARALMHGSVQFRVRGLPWHRLLVPVAATIFAVGLLGLIVRLLPLFGPDGPGVAGAPSLVVAFVCGAIIGPVLAYDVRWAFGRRSVAAVVLSLTAALSAIGLLFIRDTLPGLGLGVLHGAAIGGLTNLIWERVALVVTDHATATGVRIDAPAFALITTCIKLSIALSSALFGVVLDGFKRGAGWSWTAIVVLLALGGLGCALALGRRSGHDPDSNRVPAFASVDLSPGRS